MRSVGRRDTGESALLPGLVGRRLPPCVDGTGNPIPGSIAEWSRARIGGVDQWMAIRGCDLANPVLLFLHGGPGTPETPFLFHFNRGLSDHVTLVAWEQRGAGRSYSRSIPAESMTFGQFVDDTIEVTRVLRDRFGQERIYLAGHSWGALVGIVAAQKAPELYRAYIGISQPVDFARSLIAIRRWALDAAQAKGNARAVRALKRLGERADGRFARPLDTFASQMKWAIRLGGAFVESSWARVALSVFLPSPVYSMADKIRYAVGARYSAEHLMGEVEKRNLSMEVPRLGLPAYFVHGRHDGQVPPGLAEEYVRSLEAPSKQLVFLERSAHGALFEEPEAFQEILVKRVLVETASER